MNAILQKTRVLFNHAVLLTLIAGLAFSTKSYSQILTGNVVTNFVFLKTTNCNANDLDVVGAYLNTGGLCGITNCSNGTATLPLILKIDNKTGSYRTSVAILAKLKVNGEYYPNSQNPYIISRCVSPDPISPTSQSGIPPSNGTPWNVAIGNITVPCSGRLELVDILMAWTDASKGSTCESMVKGVSPKCGLGTSTVIEKGFEFEDAEVTNNTNCSGGGNGSITYSFTGGATPYKYSLTGNNFTSEKPTLTGLSEGTYTVYAKDANDCPAQFTRQVTSVGTAPSGSITAFTNNTNCSTPGNGSITYSFSGGSAPYTYSTTVNGTYGTGPVLTALSAGTYYVYAKGANGCIGSVSKTITNTPSNPADPTASAFTNPSLCGSNNDGSITITAVSGSTYKLTSTAGYNSDWVPSNVFSGLAIGSYTLWIKNTNGCEKSAPFNCTTGTGNVSNSSQAGGSKFLGSAEMSDPITVKVSPNPFGNQARFLITSALAGKGTLEIYNTQGQKIKTLYNGYINAGTNYFDLKMTGQQSSQLIYVFKMNGQTLTGKLIRGNAH